MPITNVLFSDVIIALLIECNSFVSIITRWCLLSLVARLELETIDGEIWYFRRSLMRWSQKKTPVLEYQFTYVVLMRYVISLFGSLFGWEHRSKIFKSLSSWLYWNQIVGQIIMKIYIWYMMIAVDKGRSNKGIGSVNGRVRCAI